MITETGNDRLWLLSACRLRSHLWATKDCNGSGHDRRPAELTAAEQPLTVGRPEAAPRHRVQPTHTRHRHFSGPVAVGLCKRPPADFAERYRGNSCPRTPAADASGPPCCASLIAPTPVIKPTMPREIDWLATSIAPLLGSASGDGRLWPIKSITQFPCPIRRGHRRPTRRGPYGLLRPVWKALRAFRQQDSRRHSRCPDVNGVGQIDGIV